MIVSDMPAYLALVRTRPELFANPPGAGFEILLEDADIRQAQDYMADKLESAGAPAEWAEVGVAFRDQYLFLLRDAVRFPDGSLGTYIRFIEPDGAFPGVVILPVWNDQVLLIRHFRHATRRWHLEIPRGFGVSADARESARIELQEEIGAQEIQLTALGETYPDAGADAGCVEMFYASVGSFEMPELHEAITDILPTPVPEFERMIREGELKDGYLLAAYGLAKAKNLILS